jgi:hypothetical protein
MGRDRSLEEFLDGTSEGTDGEGTDRESRSDADSDPGVDSESDLDIESGSDAGSDPGIESTPDPSADSEPDADDARLEPSDGVEPAAVTYRWDPGSVGCAECGATVEQLWSGESGQVCAECKEW